MPQVIIHKVLTNDRQRNGRLAEEVRKVLQTVLNVDENHGRVIIYEAPIYDRSNHEDGNENFVFVEVTIFAGKSAQTKQQLVEAIIEQIETIEGVVRNEINCVIHEITPENYLAGKVFA